MWWREYGKTRPEALNHLFTTLYPTLRRRARNVINSENYEYTMFSSALVGEALIGLHKSEKSDWNDEEHFINHVTRRFRNIRRDQRRRNTAGRRDRRNTDRMGAEPPCNYQVTNDVLDTIDRGLVILEKNHPDWFKVTSMKLDGFSEREIAEHLSMPARTAQRYWKNAREFLGKLVERGS